MEDDRLKNKNFIDAWKKAFSGIWYAIKTQRNVKIQLAIAVVIIAICIIAKPSKVECIFLTFATMLVIIAEVMNTAIEATVDLVTKEYHPMAKIAKDVAAGAVVLAAINAVIVAILIIFM
mgnify:FL=1